MLRNLMLISNILLVVFSFGLGIFSLVRNPKSKVVRLWFLASMAVTIWAVGYLLSLTSPDAETGFRNLKIVYFGASLIPILSFHFITAFLYQDIAHKYLLIIGYIVSLIFLYFTTLTSSIITGARYLEKFGQYEEIETKWFLLFLAYFLFFSFYGIYLLYKGYRQSDGIRRKQCLYLMIALLIGFLGGISNFVTDLTGIYPYGQFFVWLYPVIITYGIFGPFQIRIVKNF